MRHLCFVITVLSATFLSQSYAELQCYRCYHSTCDQEVSNPAVCTATKEFLKQLGTNLVADGDQPCPSPTDDWHNSKYMETCQSDKSFCGKRVIRLNVQKYSAVSNNNGTHDEINWILLRSTTPYPILKPQGPSIHDHTFTIYSCNHVEPDCNREKYSTATYNHSLEEVSPSSSSSVSTLVFKAKLTDESDCTRCRINLCNKDEPYDPPMSGNAMNSAFGIYFIFQLSLFAIYFSN